MHGIRVPFASQIKFFSQKFLSLQLSDKKMFLMDTHSRARHHYSLSYMRPNMESSKIPTVLYSLVYFLSVLHANFVDNCAIKRCTKKSYSCDPR